MMNPVKRAQRLKKLEETKRRKRRKFAEDVLSFLATFEGRATENDLSAHFRIGYAQRAILREALSDLALAGQVHVSHGAGNEDHFRMQGVMSYWLPEARDQKKAPPQLTDKHRTVLGRIEARSRDHASASLSELRALVGGRAEALLSELYHGGHVELRPVGATVVARVPARRQAGAA